MKKTILIALTIIAMSLSANAQEEKKESKVIHLTYKEFIKKVWDFEKDPNTFNYKGKLPAIVDFYADWCGPCRRVAPIMERMAEEYEHRPGARTGLGIPSAQHPDGALHPHGRPTHDAGGGTAGRRLQKSR